MPASTKNRELGADAVCPITNETSLAASEAVVVVRDEHAG
jgi:hypothetical protein